MTSGNFVAAGARSRHPSGRRCVIRLHKVLRADLHSSSFCTSTSTSTSPGPREPRHLAGSRLHDYDDYDDEDDNVDDDYADNDDDNTDDDDDDDDDG